MTTTSYMPLTEILDGDSGVLPFTWHLSSQHEAQGYSLDQSADAGRTHDAGRTLSLHEYRRQQGTSNQSALTLRRSLKRRRGAPDLSSIERVPEPVTSSQHASTRQRKMKSLLPALQSFQFPTTTSESLTTQQSYQPLRTTAAYDVPRRSASAAPVGSKVRDFKPIRHLPKPEVQRAEQLFATVSFAPEPWSTSSGGTRPVTSSPTASLSKFPDPPKRTRASPATRPFHDGSSSPRPNPDLGPDHVRHVGSPKPATPQVLHYRGASFDMINPRQSLQLENLHTPPGGRDSDCSDYFGIAVLPYYLSWTDMTTEGLQELVPADMTREMPQRALFDNYHSAHETITTRSKTSTPRSNGIECKDFAAGPINLPPAASNPNAKTNSSNHGDRSSKHGSSVKKRLSKVWKGALDSFRVMDHAISDQGGELTTFSQQRDTTDFPMAHQSAPGLMRLPTSSLTSSPGADGSGSTNGVENKAASHSNHNTFYPSSILSSKTSHPSDQRRSQTRSGLPYLYEADHADLADRIRLGSGSAYIGNSSDAHQGPSGSLSRPGSRSPDKDSTLQAIVSQYQNMGFNSSEISLTGTHAHDAYSLPIDFAPMQHRAQHSFTTSKDKLSAPSSSHGSSSAAGPKTPDTNTCHTPRGHIIYSSAGAPPNIPLPPLDARYGSAAFNVTQSDINSGTGSYGDTRHLLLLSQQFVDETGSQLEDVRRTKLITSAELRPVPTSNSGGSPATIIRVSPSLEDASPGGKSTAVSASSRHNEHFAPRSSTASASSPTFARGMDPMAYNNATSPSSPRGHGSLSTPLFARYTTPDIELARGNRLSSPKIASSPPPVKTIEVPVLWNNLSPRPTARALPDLKPATPPSSIVAVSDSNDDDDWETIADPNRPRLERDSIMSSTSNAPSDRASSPTGEPVIGYLGHNRSSSYYSNDDQMGFASTAYVPRALMVRNPDPNSSPSPADLQLEERLRAERVNSYLQEQVSGEGQHLSDSTPADKQKDFNVFADFGPMSQHPPESPRVEITSWATDDFFEKGTGKAAASGHGTLSALLNAGPNDESIFDDELPDTPTPVRTASQYASSSPMPKSIREESFSKFTILGPKLNLTGTPQGTGMKEVGSSLAGGSSPAVRSVRTPVNSSPLVTSPRSRSSLSLPRTERRSTGTRLSFLKRTKTPEHRRMSETNTTLDQDDLPMSMVPGYAPALPMRAQHIETGNLVDLREQKRLEREERLLAAERAKELKRHFSGRASVRGQTELREMQLVKDHQDVISPVSPTFQTSNGSNSPSVSPKQNIPPVTPQPRRISQRQSRSSISTHFSALYNANISDHQHTNASSNRFGSTDTGSPLFTHESIRSPSSISVIAREVLQQQADSDLERRQHHLYITPTTEQDPDLLRRQKVISWAMFGCACCFPPLLLLMRIYGDAAITQLTGGRIMRATRQSKHAAAMMGVFFCTAIPIIVVLVIVLARAGIIG